MRQLKLIGLLFTVFCSMNMYAQIDDGTYRYADSKPINGKLKCFYANKQLAEEATLVNGKKEGVNKAYYNDGKLKKECTFKDNKLNGSFKEYYSNGKVTYSAIYVNGAREGLVQAYSETGQLEDEYNYKNGLLNGISKDYLDGKLLQKSTYIQDRLDGEFFYYHPNGKVKIKTLYKQDKKEGPEKIYAPAGTLLEDNNYLDGKRSGLRKITDTKGNPVREMTYINGFLDGEYRQYVAADLYIRRMFKNGYEVGRVTLHNAKGKLVDQSDVIYKSVYEPLVTKAMQTFNPDDDEE